MTDRSAMIGALKTLIAEVPADQLPALIGELEATKAVAWARLTVPPTPAVTAAGQEMLTANELAHVFSVPKSFFYELARRKRVPCTRLGRYVRFNRADVERSLAEDSKIARLGSRKKHRGNGRLERAATTLLPGGSAAEGARPA